VFLREFILGQNRTGLRAQQSQNDVSEEEPEVERFDERIIKEYSAPVFTGVARTQGSTSWPSATVEAWEKFIATAATAQATAGISTDGQISRGYRVSGTDKTVERCWWIVVILLFARIVYI
jgi:carboxypeptidase D